jgi:hypothetical protein
MPGNSRHFEKPMAQEFIHIMKTKSVRSLGRLSEWPELRRCLRWMQSAEKLGPSFVGGREPAG